MISAAKAQPPQMFKYQGLARGSDGNPVSNTTISLRISIHQGNPAGTVVYKETHNPLTNEFGSFSVNIGGGTVVTGNFSTIPWGRHSYFQEVEMDVNGGSSFVSMGTSQYLSVPYALAADSARKGIAPFWVQNTFNGNDTSSVAFIALSNGEAPTIFCKNFATGGTSFHAVSSNGIYFRVESDGFKTNGLSTFEGKVLMQDSLLVFGDLGISGGDLSVGGNGQVNGDLNVSGSEQVFGNLTVSLNEQVNGNITGFGNLILVSGNAAVQSLSVGNNANISGNLNVAGTLSKGAGSFKIDHPLDPANKYLYHSFVESPDMKNIYDGTVTTNAEGNAAIELPAYFEVLNRDFRYQLTAIGQFAQAIVSQEITNNIFCIKTDKPNVKISWQVTGIRKDAYAEKNRIVPEVEKDKSEKGKYLYPDAYGQVPGKK